MVDASDSNARVVQLTARDQAVEPAVLLASFLPQPRFSSVRFSNYEPNPGFASQTQVRDRLERLAAEPLVRKGLGWFGRKPEPGVGVYLDGGFGVGKTHLLAATWHAFAGQKFLLIFSELTFTIGALGMDRALKAFSSAQLVCIDEFELDDIGNTLARKAILKRDRCLIKCAAPELHKIGIAIRSQHAIYTRVMIITQWEKADLHRMYGICILQTANNLFVW